MRRRLTQLQSVRPLQSLTPPQAELLRVMRMRGRRLQQRNVRLMWHSPLCVECDKRGLTTAATEWDHIVPLWKGGRDEEGNLQGLCSSCHAKKTAAEAAERAGRA
jgi:5-methylcytosine-specific restriction enzyme A